ncbi:Mitochondrial glycine transporter, partial [Dissostichus eleginoides]
MSRLQRVSSGSPDSLQRFYFRSLVTLFDHAVLLYVLQMTKRNKIYCGYVVGGNAVWRGMKGGRKQGREREFFQGLFKSRAKDIPIKRIK